MAQTEVAKYTLNNHTLAGVLANTRRNTHGMHWDGGDKYNVVSQIGKGAFAIVYKVATILDGELFAIKEIEKRKFIKNGTLNEKVNNELNIMRRLDHVSSFANI